MLDFLFVTQSTETITLANTMIIILSALGLGFLISLVYMYTHREDGYAKSFSNSLIMLPGIVAMIILLVGSNVARAFSLAGAFSLIRFRSAPGDSSDISYVFATVAIGLSCGMGYVGYAAIFAFVLIVVSLVLFKMNFGSDKQVRLGLKILIPEDMDYYGVFDNVFETYCNKAKLLKVRTKEFGSLYELNYSIIIKEEEKIKECVDKIRAKNGNLKVEIIVLASEEGTF